MSDNSSSSSSNSSPSSSSSSSNSSNDNSPSTSYNSPYSSLSIPRCMNYSEDIIKSSPSALPSATQFRQQQQSEMIFYSQNQEHRRSSRSENEPVFSNLSSHTTTPQQSLLIPSESESEFETKVQCHNHSSTCGIICSESCRKEKIESALGWLKKQEEFRGRGY